jgi:hypothetical protein
VAQQFSTSRRKPRRRDTCTDGALRDAGVFGVVGIATVPTTDTDTDTDT